MEKQFMILVVRLLAAILAGQNWKTRRSDNVLKSADRWVAEREQHAGVPLSGDYLTKE